MRQSLTGLLAIAVLAATPSLGVAQNAPPVPLKIGRSLPLRVSWSRSSAVLASAFTASLLMDAGQTRGLARGGWQQFREANPILGRSPSVARVNMYTVVAGLTVFGAAAAMPARVRPWFLGAALLIESVAVVRNARAGVGIRFPY